MPIPMILRSHHITQLFEEARRAAPLECGGWIIGKFGLVGAICEPKLPGWRIVPLHNASKRQGFFLAQRPYPHIPDDWGIVAWYHSHPHGRCWPSAFDYRQMKKVHPLASIIIGRPPTIRVFRSDGEIDLVVIP